jgi:hypothetical protein
MKPARTLLALAAVLLAGGLLAACGSDDKETYAEEVQDVLDPLAAALQPLGAELSQASTGPELVDGLRAAETEISDSATELEELSVPDDVTEVNDDLVAAISGFGGELAAIREAAEAGDLEQLEALATALPQVTAQFQTELGEIQTAAIDAGVPIEGADEE